jgi:hypothetical protein
LLAGDVDKNALFGPKNFEVEEVGQIRTFRIEGSDFKGDVIAG